MCTVVLEGLGWMQSASERRLCWSCKAQVAGSTHCGSVLRARVGFPRPRSRVQNPVSRFTLILAAGTALVSGNCCFRTLWLFPLRCFFIAQSYVLVKKWSEALVLYDRVLKYANEVSADGGAFKNSLKVSW